jgi:hypothetical protein
MINRRHCIRIGFLLIGAALAMALVAVGFANAGIDQAGTTAANFLTLGAGARVLGMGGATLGLGTDLTAGTWNPAALGWMDDGSIALTHAGLDNGSLQEWIGMGGRFGHSGTRWSLSGLYQGDGTFDGRDASNNSTGSFSTASFAAGGHLAQQVGSMLTLGFGAKAVSEKLADVTGFGVTFDGGVMFRRGIVSLGVAGTNVLGQMKYSGATYEFPTNYGVGLGLSHAASGLSLAVDANFPSAYYSDVRVGAEWRWKQMLALRAGYRSENGATADPLTGPTFGLGAGTNGFWLDYGYLIGAGSEGQHRLALTFFPGKFTGIGGDPFGQGEIPSQFDDSGKDKPLIGPPVPPELQGKKKR